MDFRTTIPVQQSGQQIDHTHSLVFIGSCFAENIGERFQQLRFQTDINPFGVLYNPLAIAVALRRLISIKPYTEKDLFPHDGLWHSEAHHSRFSHKDSDICLEKINSQLVASSKNLRSADYLFITFGTAWVYEWARNGKVVANCHKLPGKHFIRRRLEVEEIVKEYNDLIAKLRTLNPRLKIVFTVSPIRHWKDGAHENSLSKSTLLLAIDNFKDYDLLYFPAYEIVNDELRDYRFYASDMIHPSEVAIDYIWERIDEIFFSEKTHQFNDAIMQINKARNHRPFDPESEAHKRFIVNIETKEKELSAFAT